LGSVEVREQSATDESARWMETRCWNDTERHVAMLLNTLDLSEKLLDSLISLLFPERQESVVY
jgi:hypothetical protein